MLQVIKGRIVKPRRIVLYGVAGIGKGTFAAGAPSPIFIQTEDGNDDIGVDRLPVCRTLEELQKHLRMILLEDHDYRTLVLDSLDQSETLIHSIVAAGAGKASVGDIGYGRGYDEAVADVRKILFVLDKIREVRGMTVILIGHAKIERFEDPGNEAYDRYSLQMHRKAAAEVMHWADEVLFANYKTFVRKTEQGFRERNVAAGTGERFLFTREMPAYYAKNRLDLPPELPMPKEGGWDVFAQYLRLDPTPTQAAGAEGAVVTQPGSSEPAVQAPAAVPPDPAVQSAAVPEAVAEAAAILGMDVPDLDAMDVDQLRDFGLSLAPKFSKSRAASMRAAIKARNAEKMREIIRYVMTKPDVSGVSGED